LHQLFFLYWFQNRQSGNFAEPDKASLCEFPVFHPQNEIKAIPMFKMIHTKSNISTFQNPMRVLVSILFSFCLLACGNEKPLPDISQVDVQLNIQQFERDFFTIDSMNPQPGLNNLIKKYPVFTPLFVSNVLGLGPISDSNELIKLGLRRYIHLNQGVYNKVEEKFRNTNLIRKELETAFRYLKYYYPDYKVPIIYTTIGPLDALPPLSSGEPSPNYMGTNFLAIGLQFYLGANYDVYQDQAFITNIAPKYRSRRFSEQYLAADVMKLLLDDIYPDSSNRLPLGEQFIEKGKRLYLLQSLLPEKHDTIITGYTNNQLKWCIENEREIYNFFLQQQLFYERDLALIAPFTSDGPFTQGMPESSPGNIGAFIGLQIVNAYVKNHKGKINPADVMKIKAAEIFKESGYKPR